MKFNKVWFVVCMILVPVVRTFAWGPDGHKITAAVAYHCLDERTRDSVHAYLGKLTLEDVSTWMDEIRSDPKYDALKPLHYINIERGEVYVPGKEENIVTEIEKVVAELKERNKHSREDVIVDIKILAHLLGDIHQPLHVGFGSDKGGNQVQVMFMHRNSNLHRVWDSDIIEQYNVTAKACIKRLSKYSKEDIARIEKTDVLAWMKESRTHLKQAYDFNAPNLDYEYGSKNMEVIEDQLIVGGIRLAYLLESIFENK
jgi:hypothetical protein